MTLKDVIKLLQGYLNEHGSKLTVDGIFGPKTRAAFESAISAPVVPPVVPPVLTGAFNRSTLAVLAEALGKEHVKEGSTRHKEIIKPFAEKPVSFGYGTWSWCGATVHYLCRLAGLNIPLMCPSKFGYTFALVEAWQQWAIEAGFYHDNDGAFQPEPGDVSCFDWSQSRIDQGDTDWENHIGVHLGKSGSNYISAEGNTSNMTDIKTRTPIQIQGWIRIPDGYVFSGK